MIPMKGFAQLFSQAPAVREMGPLINYSTTDLYRELENHILDFNNQRVFDMPLRLTRDAFRLAARLESIQNFKNIEPLYDAHQALRRYWSPGWFSHGISELTYRVRLKAAMLFLRGTHDTCTLAAIAAGHGPKTQ